MPLLRVSDDDHPVEIHYEDVGSGRPVVLIHGWPLSGRSWEPQVPALVEAGYRVVTYDRRGFGASSQPWDGYDYDTLAADLAALLDGLDLHDAVLVGFSMGGGEVARYLGTHSPERVAGAVFAAAVTPYLYRSDDNPDGGLDDAIIGQFEAGVKGDRIEFLEGFTRDFFTAGDRSDLVSEPQRAYQRSIAEFASPKATLDCIGAFGRTDFRADLAKVRVPTLVIHGDSDGIVPFEVSGRRTHEAIPGSTLVLVEGAPHGLNATHADRFNDALIAFLRGPVGDDAAAEPPARHEAPAPDGRHGAEADHQEVADTTPPATEPAASADTVAASEPVAVPEPVTVDDPADASDPVAASNPGAATTVGDPLADLTWRTAEQNDPDNETAGLPAREARRRGWTADPNLGDVPVDDQPHPGS